MDYNFRFGALWRYRGQILDGVLLTLQFSVFTIICGLLIGLLAAMASTSTVRGLRVAARVYVEAIRNTPLLVQLFIIYFGLPSLGIRLGANTAALIALSVNLGAYAAEILRAGFESVRRSQVEAGRALGLTAGQTFRHVILFQALKAIYPALTSQFVMIMLTTSVVSSIGGTELFNTAAFINSRTYLSFEVYALITASYLVLTIGFRSLFAVVHWLVFVRRSRA